MGVSVIQGVNQIINFADYNAAASATQYFSTSTEAYNYMLENAYKMGSSGAVRGVIDGGKVAGKIVEFQPGVTGGTAVGIDVAEVTESAIVGEEVGVTTGAASLTAVPVIEIVGGILAGLGVGILSYEANKDFWIDISNNLFLNFPGYEPITYENIEDMSLLTLFKNGKTYVDASLVQSVNNYLIAHNAFDSTSEIVIDIPVDVGTADIDSCPVTIGNIKSVASGLLQHYAHAIPAEAHPYVDDVCEEACNYLRMHPALAVNATNFMVSIGILYGFQLSVNIRLFTDEMPTTKTITSTMIDSGFTYIDQQNIRSTCDVWAYIYITSPTTHGSGDNGPRDFQRWAGYRSGRDGNTDWWGTTSINNDIVVIPDIPELPPLQPRTISTTPDSIPTELPDWWANMLELGQIDPATGTVVYPKFLPVSVPNTSPRTNPVTTPQTDIQTGRVPDTNPKPVGDSVLPLINDLINNPWKKPNDPTPTPTPTPSIPVIPAIGGQANKLFTVYNPTQANLDALGSTLWTQNIITQIVQMFTNNPMDAVISLHILYATPTTGANKEIKLGYVPTGVTCPEVTNQYVNINCGTVRVPELFGDTRDYANTEITIYLPMIGFRQLKTEDAMASYITVDYKVDVFTGTVLANITVTRDSTNQVFYTFEGNCAVNLPLTGADKSRQLASAVGVIGATVMGSPLMGMASMAGIAGGGAKAGMTRSGNFTGNAGAMGCKKPYIIVSSNVPYDAVGYNAQYGYPANLTVMLGTCHGYVKAKEVHADSIANATEKEKREIENQLKQGVIIH